MVVMTSNMSMALGRSVSGSIVKCSQTTAESNVGGGTFGLFVSIYDNTVVKAKIGSSRQRLNDAQEAVPSYA